MKIRIEGENGQFVEKDFYGKEPLDAAKNYSEDHCKGWGKLTIQEVETMKVLIRILGMVKKRKRIKGKKGKRSSKTVEVEQPIAEVEKIFTGTSIQLEDFCKNIAAGYPKSTGYEYKIEA